MTSKSKPEPRCRRIPNGNAFEYEVESFGASRDSLPEYTVDLSPQNFGCSCPHDDYTLRPRRKAEGTTRDTICKHLGEAMKQFYLDNVINK